MSWPHIISDLLCIINLVYIVWRVNFCLKRVEQRAKHLQKNFNYLETMIRPTFYALREQAIKNGIKIGTEYKPIYAFNLPPEDEETKNENCNSNRGA